MGSFLNLLKLIELSFKTRQKYDLLVKNSLALSLFWFLTLFAPVIPYSNKIPGLSEYAEYATREVLIISFRSILIVFLPLVLGFLYLASDEFEERYAYRPIKTNDFVEGLQMFSKRYDLKSKELLNLFMLALGKGVILIFNWIIIYFLIILGMVSEIWGHLISKDIKDEFFEIVHFRDEAMIIENTIRLIDAESKVYKTKDPHSVPLLHRPLLFFGKLFLGDITLITSKQMDVLLTSSGIGAIGSMEKLRNFYTKLIDLLLLQGTMTKFPLSIEIESNVKEGSVEYAPLYREENVPIEDIKWIRIKELLDYEKVGKE
ncbi:MAG: hypothetical protein ACE5J5_06820 [Candidatus Hydrothermarchaeales archaeon]